MGWWYRSILLIVLFIIHLSPIALAQEEGEYDYRYYKFYDTGDESLILLEERPIPRMSNMPTINSRSEYALRALNYRYMGERNIERNIFGGVEVDYTTARLLSGLRFQRVSDVGFASHLSSSPLHKTNRYIFGDDYYTANTLGVALTGRKSLGRISYFGSYKPEYNGVMLNSGWEYRYSARVSYGNDLYIKGVYGDAVDLAFSASYNDRRSTLHIVALLPYSRRGLYRASVEEAYQLLGDRHYNPLWGMQGGKVRNSREATLLRPEALMLWDYRLMVATTLSVTLDVSYAREGTTSLSWFNAPTPNPDNYHYLPSYYSLTDDSKAVADVWLGNDLRYTQVDWEGLYHTNALQSDGHARYAVESRREDVATGALTAQFKTAFEGFDVEYGASFNAERGHRYKVLEDMLGATHIDNLDYFYVDDDTNTNGLRNDLRGSDVTVVEGDTFGYNYLLSRVHASLFGRLNWSSDNLHISLLANMATERFRREGLYEKELFPGAGSWGRSHGIVLKPYSISGVVDYTYGNHLFGATLAAEGKSPNVDDLFYNPDYNNRIVDNVGLSKSYAMKVAYSYLPNTRVSYGVQFFAMSYSDESRVIRYYDDLAGLYANGLAREISRLSYGADIYAQVRWNSMLSSNFRAVVSSYRYAKDAELNIYSDSDNMLIRSSAVALRNLHTGASELALYGDISYSYRGWYARLAMSWCDGGYVETAFVPRTESVLLCAVSDEERSMLVEQEALPAASALDLSVSKSINLKGGQSLLLSIAINNMLGGSWVVQGYETNRVKVVSNGDISSVQKRASTLRYSYPSVLNLSINCYF